MNTIDPHAENKRLYALDEAAVGPEEAPKRWQIKCYSGSWINKNPGCPPCWMRRVEYRRDPRAPPLPSMDWHEAPSWATWRYEDSGGVLYWGGEVPPGAYPKGESRPNPEWFALTAPNKETDMSDETLSGPNALRAVADSMDAGERPEIYQWRFSDGWVTTAFWPDLVSKIVHGNEIRRKPATHTVTLESGEKVQVPKPMTEVPDSGTQLWVLFDDDGPEEPHIAGVPQALKIRSFLAQGRCYATHEAREQAERAVTRILTGGAS